METTLEKSKQESKLELYSLLNEGYRDIKEGRTTSLEEFKEEIRQRRINDKKRTPYLYEVHR